MLDDLRNSASRSFIDEMPAEEADEKKESTRILGMTAPQRFLVSVMLLVLTCVIGTFVLIAFGKLSL
jgi:hypothetical protein